jgi:hypothetical protein
MTTVQWSRAEKGRRKQEKVERNTEEENRIDQCVLNAMLLDGTPTFLLGDPTNQQ